MYMKTHLRKISNDHPHWQKIHPLRLASTFTQSDRKYTLIILAIKHPHWQRRHPHKVKKHPQCMKTHPNYASRRSRTRNTVKLTVCVCLSVCVSVPVVTAQRLQYDEN